MPEGDTVWKVARALRPVLESEALETLWLREGGAVPEAEGVRVAELATLGKHFLLALENDLVVHVHLGLNGQWQRRRAGAPWRRSPAGATLRIDTAEWQLAAFATKTAALVRRQDLARHPVLTRLGPDLLAESVDFVAVLARARRRDVASAYELLLDQRVACGIGNALACEVLFLERVDPARPARELADAEIDACYRRARELLLANLGAWPRTTTRPVRTGEPWPAGVPRLHVYGRAGEPCLRCGAKIEARRLGAFASVASLCPACQSR